MAWGNQSMPWPTLPTPTPRLRLVASCGPSSTGRDTSSPYIRADKRCCIWSTRLSRRMTGVSNSIVCYYNMFSIPRRFRCICMFSGNPVIYNGSCPGLWGRKFYVVLVYPPLKSYRLGIERGLTSSTLARSGNRTGPRYGCPVVPGRRCRRDLNVRANPASERPGRGKEGPGYRSGESPCRGCWST